MSEAKREFVESPMAKFLYGAPESGRKLGYTPFAVGSKGSIIYGALIVMATYSDVIMRMLEGEESKDVPSLLSEDTALISPGEHRGFRIVWNAINSFELVQKIQNF